MNPTPPDPPRSFLDYFLPWRWAWLGWLTTFVLLAAGVPLFLRMPLWADANLYDTAAYNLLSGGVHYRDVFDTNLPGFVAVLTVVRWLFGPSMEAVRAVDLAFVIAISVLILRFANKSGATHAGIAWAAAGMASFYLYISEFNHLQRDVWMMLPVLGACAYRFRRLTRLSRNDSERQVFVSATLEGVIWGLAFWVKPHVAVMAIAAWLVLATRLAGTSDRPFHRLLADLAGVFLGGLLIGGAGFAWLYFSGTLPYFFEVFEKWNTQYFNNVMATLEVRYQMELTYFPPWSLLTKIAVALAALNLIDGRIWSRRWDRVDLRQPGLIRRVWRGFMFGPPDDTARLVRALFSAIYISWALMALVLQREFHYAHVPEVFLMIGLFAANRWPVNFALIVLQILTSALVLAAVDKPEHPQWRKDLNKWHLKHTVEEDWWPYGDAVKLHPATNPERMAWWPTSLHRDVPRELRNGVAFDSDFHVGVNWVELGAVEDYLREQGVKDGDVLCWHDSPHALYRALAIKPGFRFMHVTTASEMGPWQYQQVKAARDAAAPHLRFVVYDLYRVTDNHIHLHDLMPDGLPRSVPPIQRTMFPLNQPIVFRSPSGRYIVSTIRFPLGECKIPHSIGTDEYK